MMFNLNSVIESTSTCYCTESSRDFCHFFPPRMDNTPSTKNDKNLSNLQHINTSRNDSTTEFRFKQHGLTLIEVLVALAILAIALTALLQNTAGTIQTTHRLDEINSKHWVAMQALTAIQLKIISFDVGENSDHTTKMLGKTWYWKAKSRPTFIKTMDEITITVSDQKTGPFTDPLVGFRHG